VADPLNIP